ncbi:MAG: FAD-dependent oxidoreductase [Bacteroidota bacterium]
MRKAGNRWWSPVGGDLKYDVVIIGAGMGGLSAGAFLAREGKTVPVVEKHDKPGRYMTSLTLAFRG